MSVPDGVGEAIRTRVYTTGDGRAVIEQSQGAVVVLSAAEIMRVIAELRACYDYCAAWKQPAPDQDDSAAQEAPR